MRRIFKRALTSAATCIAGITVIAAAGCASLGGSSGSSDTQEFKVSIGQTTTQYGVTVALKGAPNSSGVMTDVTMTLTATRTTKVDVSMDLNGWDGNPNSREGFQGAYSQDYGSFMLTPSSEPPVLNHIYPQNYGWTTATGGGSNTYNSLTDITVTVHMPHPASTSTAKS